MLNHLIRLALASGVMAVLAACTTPPPASPASPSSPAGRPAPATVARTQPSQNPEATGTPAERAPGISLTDEVPSSPSLLNGELPREFQRGHASWYGPGFHNRRTASGERFDMNAFTAAHRTLPFGTLVRVRSLVNGREVDVRITDRGPYSGNRIIDLSRAAADELGMLGLGFKQVVLFVPESTPQVAELTPPPPRRVIRKRAAPAKR